MDPKTSLIYTIFGLKRNFTYLTANIGRLLKTILQVLLLYDSLNTETKN